jgi:hypothetical protein
MIQTASFPLVQDVPESRMRFEKNTDIRSLFRDSRDVFPADAAGVFSTLQKDLPKMNPRSVFL